VREITPELARNFGLSETSGVVIVEVQPNSPAQEAGLAPGDLILEIDQVEVKDLEQFNKMTEDYKAGDTILFLIERRGSTLFLTLTVPE